jgi:ribonucleoside-diphosphate reductase beta chain
MPLDKAEMVYGDNEYPWALEFWKRAQQMHWLADEVPMGKDVGQYKSLPRAMRAALDKIFLFFVQSDVEVLDCYHDRYARIFKPVEVKMMLAAFSNMETIHVHAYKHLLDTLGIPKEQAHAFKDYEEMKAKSDWFRSFQPDDPFMVAETLAAVSGFGEGLALFASFAILLNFPRQNLMTGMGQIVSWSVRDESLHCDGIMRIFHAWLAEHPEIDRTLLRERVQEIAREAVKHEDAFIDLVFADGDMPGLTATELKRYIRHIANMRMRQLGYWDIFSSNEAENLDWVDALAFAQEHANFFEQRGTEYTKAASTGEWDNSTYS